MQFVDLRSQQSRLKKDITDKIEAVLKHGQYILGPEVKMLEEQLSNFAGVSHAIGCSSGTDALLLALMAYDIEPGDAVFTTPFTFIATAEVIQLLGATPVFVDIDPKTYNIDPESLKQAIDAINNHDASTFPLPDHHPEPTLNPRGIISVDLFGLPADYDQINKIARGNGLFVIEDAAQSFGAEYKGNKTCSLADIACTSFFPAKPLGCYGDGGMCFTNDENKTHILRSLLSHGKGSDKYNNVRIGINGRLDTIQAAILLSKFSIFSNEIELRQEVAQHYSELLMDLNIDVRIPFIPPDIKSAWAQYSVLLKNADTRLSTINKFKDLNIPFAIYYPVPLHLQEAFKFLGYKKGDFPVSEAVSEKILSIPMHPYLTSDDQKNIIKAFIRTT